MQVSQGPECPGLCAPGHTALLESPAEVMPLPVFTSPSLEGPWVKGAGSWVVESSMNLADIRALGTYLERGSLQV